VRLLTWNLQWCRGLDGIVDAARIAHEARRFADPDVFCFQEVNVGFADLPGASAENQVETLRREFPGYAVFFVSAVDVPGPEGTRQRFGNLLASRLPVGRVLRHTLPWPATSAPSMPRAALEAVVQAPFGALRVTTTHLEYYSSGHRAAQIERLRELHSETNHETATGENEGPFRPLPHPESAVVCGDFNLPPDDPLRARFLEAFVRGAPKFRDAWEVLHPNEPHPHTFRVHERQPGQSPYCCDYVFITEELAPRLRSIAIDGANRASDHQPVMIELA
jgi:endonuclease/exonuclease/phosphatase family metal-dependent hydrolase